MQEKLRELQDSQKKLVKMRILFVIKIFIIFFLSTGRRTTGNAKFEAKSGKGTQPIKTGAGKARKARTVSHTQQKRRFPSEASVFFR